jgi:hypothetical protein
VRRKNRLHRPDAFEFMQFNHAFNESDHIDAEMIEVPSKMLLIGDIFGLTSEQMSEDILRLCLKVDQNAEPHINLFYDSDSSF